MMKNDGVFVVKCLNFCNRLTEVCLATTKKYRPLFQCLLYNCTHNKNKVNTIRVAAKEQNIMLFWSEIYAQKSLTILALAKSYPANSQYLS
jgi:hypothetical protein